MPRWYDTVFVNVMMLCYLSPVFFFWKCKHCCYTLILKPENTPVISCTVHAVLPTALDLGHAPHLYARGPVSKKKVMYDVQMRQLFILVCHVEQKFCACTEFPIFCREEHG